MASMSDHVIAPERDVVRVIEVAGPRGGRLFAHLLDCGCTLTLRAKEPKKRARCISCAVRSEVQAELLGVDPLELVLVEGKVVDQYVHSLRDCLALARRYQRGNGHDVAWWEHIIRFCDKAGIKPTVLRDVGGVQVAVLDEGDGDPV